LGARIDELQTELAGLRAERDAYKEIIEAIYRPGQCGVFLKQRGWKKSHVGNQWYQDDGYLKIGVDAIGVEARKLFEEKP
jgi:hypothetical protein